MRFRILVNKIIHAVKQWIPLIVIIMLFTMHDMPHSFRQSNTAEDLPVVVREEKYYLGAVKDYAISGEHLYLLLDERGILMQYDLSGRFEQSYGVKQSPNGLGQLYLDGNRLCWETKDKRYFFFSDGAYQELSRELAQQMGNEIHRSRIGSKARPHIAADGFEYSLKWGSIWREKDGNLEKIVPRPVWLSMFDPMVAYIAAGIGMGITILYSIINRKQRK